MLDFNTITLTWIGIALCITQSAIFSGLNLAMFSLSRLRLETEADSGDRDAIKVLAIRRDSNFLLTTILWGNVSINVLLALLSDSIMTGVGAFIFSTVVITTVENIKAPTPVMIESDSNANNTLIDTFPHKIVVKRKFESRRMAKTLIASRSPESASVSSLSRLRLNMAKFKPEKIAD